MSFLLTTHSLFLAVAEFQGRTPPPSSFHHPHQVVTNPVFEPPSDGELTIAQAVSAIFGQLSWLRPLDF